MSVFTFAILVSDLPMILLVIIGAVILVACGLYHDWVNSPEQKGKRGEGWVNSLISRHLDSNVYHLIPDVTLPVGKGTTQIDHIVVSEYGIFVIETKNMKGWIYGDEKQRRWTQVNYKKKNSFQNPLHQNYKHVKTLEKLLGLKSDQFHSVVVFMGESTFKTKMPENVVWGGGACAKYIKSKRQHVIEACDVADIIKKIESGRLAQGKQTDQLHVHHLRTGERTMPPDQLHIHHVRTDERFMPSDQLHIHHVRTDERFMPPDRPAPVENVCPRCGSPMILRTAKRGPNPGSQFWGCSRYPKCRGTRKCAHSTSSG